MADEAHCPQNVELTTTEPVQIVRSDNQEWITGYAVVWYDPANEGTVYRITDVIEERVAPTSFDTFLRSGSVVKANYNHDKNFELGRTNNLTLFLSVDNKGLNFKIPFDSEDPDHLKVKARLRKGTARGCSFAANGLTKIKKDGSKYIRTIEQIEALDHVSIVDDPAYPGTSAIVRSAEYIQTAQAEIERYERLQKAKAVADRLRIKP